MSQPPHDPYPRQPDRREPYGSYPPPQQPDSYPPHQPAGGYPPQQPGGYPSQHSGGYPPHQPGGGYPPHQPGGYPSQDFGGFPPPRQPEPVSAQPYGTPSAPAPEKKSGARKIVLISLAVVLVLCLGGGAVAFLALKDEVKETVDATRTRVVAPPTLAGRPKATDPNLQEGARKLEAELNKSIPGASSTVGAFYGVPAKKDLVMVAAASALNANPTRALDDIIKGARESEVQLDEMKTVDAGPLGGEARCGDATAEKVPLGVCVWASKGSAGIIVIYFKSGAQAQAEFISMRGQIEQKA